LEPLVNGNLAWIHRREHEVGDLFGQELFDQRRFKVGVPTGFSDEGQPSVVSCSSQAAADKLSAVGFGHQAV
jgi:hypothetical protein